MKFKTPADSAVVMTEMVLPQHTNSMGTVFGGTVVAWVDIAAGICAGRHCERPVVTACIDTMHFFNPIKLGWIANIYASVNHAFHTSCEVGVKIIAENPISGEKFHTSTGYLTFVALDSLGKPCSIPGLDPKNKVDQGRAEAAVMRREARLAFKAKLEKEMKAKGDA